MGKLFLALAACASVFAASCKSKDNSAAGKQIIRISHGQPSGHPDDQAAKLLAEHVHKNLGEKFHVLVYGQGLLGDSKHVLELCQTGAVDFVVCSSSNLESYNRLYGIFSVPFLFLDEKAYYNFMNGDVVKGLRNSTASSGFCAVEWFTAGQRSFYASRPIHTPADIKGMKIRVQPSPLNVAMMQALGAGAVPMAFGEVYSALQQGTIDAAENNELALTTVKHGEVTKFYSYDMHQMQPDFLVGNIRFLNSLNEKERAVFEEGFRMAHELEMIAWQEETEKAIKEAKEMGVEFVEADIASFHKACSHIKEDYMKKNSNTAPYFRDIERANAESR